MMGSELQIKLDFIAAFKFISLYYDFIVGASGTAGRDDGLVSLSPSLTIGPSG